MNELVFLDTGDLEATHLMQKLLKAASTPYFAMLELWLCQGVLSDPYAEFMVQEDKVWDASSSVL